MSLDELLEDPAQWPLVRDLFNSEQVCVTRITLLLEGNPQFKEFYLAHN